MLVLMSAGRHSEFLPRSRGARVVMAVLALPAFLILLLFLVGFSFEFTSSPPKSTGEAVAAIALCELFAVGCLFTLLAMIWSVATPKWLESWLGSGSRRLVAVTGGFLVTSGAAVLLPMIAFGEWIPAVLMIAGVMIGVHLLRVASRPDWPCDRREIGE
jgi:hypothetical protein